MPRHTYELTSQLNIDAEIAKATKEASDVPVARLTEKSLEDQLQETDQAIAQLEIVKRSLIHAINEEEQHRGLRRVG